MRRAALACGFLAPLAFIGAWLAAGALTPAYDPVRQAISQLARVGASHRPLMTAGFVAFGLLAPLFGLAAARGLGAPALRWSIGAAGFGTLLVAVFPLGAHDDLHAASALLGYVGQAASPLLGARALHGRARAASYAVGVASALALTASVVAAPTGLWQRTGLTLVDVWYALVALHLLRRSPLDQEIP